MRTHTNDFKTNIKNLGRQFNVRVVYGGTTLQNEEINNATLNYNGDILKSVMKMLKLDSNVDIPLNTQITFEFGLLVGNSYEYINYGTFIVEKSEKQENTNSYLLTCYDKMLYSMKPYEDLGVTYPITIRNYINALCTKLGLQFQNASDTFVNYNKQIPNELYLDEQGNSLDYNYRDVLDELAQVTASTICINDSGKLEIRYITNTNDTIDEEFLKNVNVNFGEQYGAINTITFSRSADSDSISKSIPENLPDADKIEIKISDNQILNGNNRDEFIDGILNQLYGLSYYVNDFSSTGITYYDLCDRYNITVGENTYSCVMLNDEININNGLVENIFTNMPETSKTDYSKVDKTDRKANQTYIIVNKQQGQIDAVVSRTETIEEELANPTSIKQGEYFDLEDALDSPLIDFSLYGETQQDSTTGKNKCSNVRKSASNNDLYFDFDKNVSKTITLSATINTQTAGNSVYLSIDGVSKGRQNTITGSANTRQSSVITFSDEIYEEIQNSSSRYLQIYKSNARFVIPTDAMVENGDQVSSYEPYTNGASPNPNYPQEIHNVSGDNTIEICGKNLWGEDELGNINEQTGEDISNQNRVRTKGYRNVTPNTAYTLSSNAGSNLWYIFYYYDINKNFISSDAVVAITSATKTTPNNCYYMRCVLSRITQTQRQLEKSSTASEYEPYTGNSQLISLGVENLFDNSSAYLFSNNKYVATSNDYSTRGKIQIKPNTYYLFSIASGTISDGKAYFFDENMTLLSSTNTRTSAVLTPSNAKYMGWYATSGNAFEGNKYATIIEGNVWQYVSENPIELNKISTYQDYIYKDNDRWFLHKEIGKVVLDGSESWYDSGGNAPFGLTIYGALITNSNDNPPMIYCNNFIPIPQSATWTNYESLVSTSNITTATNRLRFRYTSISTLENWQTWLSTHNTTVYYVLATPTDTEITDTTLLEQLNNLMTLPLYKNMTHITLTPNDLQPTMKIEYYRDTDINTNFLPKDEISKYYTKVETNAQIQISSSNIQQSVSELTSTVNGNTGAITTISSQVTSLQSSTRQQITIINEQLENGVEKVKTRTGFTFDEQGLSITKGEEFKNLMTDRNQVITSGGKEQLFIGYDDNEKRTVARMDWIESEHATIGVHRTETITKNGQKRTAGFYIGGGS